MAIFEITVQYSYTIIDDNGTILESNGDFDKLMDCISEAELRTKQYNEDGVNNESL